MAGKKAKKKKEDIKYTNKLEKHKSELLRNSTRKHQNSLTAQQLNDASETKPISPPIEFGKFRADQVCGSMKPRHLNCLAHFGDPPDGSIDVRESVYMYLYKEKIAREHLTGPQHYPDNGLVSGTRGKVSRNQEEEEVL
ncbi:hypothetical protein AVEN_265329-1 [Araneus ventricosus]|uniref:Uncharacterized protein n=1 Tax=Araneus ventricosus TaxID=182803 RepID=A0A4Y2MJX7_ARAVE|nr:hypothetical protein AVEN_265329-1 [Araneus ventricosus]